VPLLFHEYLYDSANLGYDDARSSDEMQDFRARMQSSLNSSQLPEHAATAGEPETLWDADEDADAQQPSEGDAGEGYCEVARRFGLAADGCASAAVALKSLEQLRMPADGEGSVRISELLAALETAHAGAALAHRPASKPDASHQPSLDASSLTHSASAALQAQPVSSAYTPASNGSTAIFAPACHLHEMMDSRLFLASHISGLTLQEFLRAWFLEAWPARLAIIDDYPTVRSSADCYGFQTTSAS
jgi:hypothetical protein